MEIASRRYSQSWTPEFWKTYCESDSPYRLYKTYTDRRLAVSLLQVKEGDMVLEAGCGYGRISQALLVSANIQLVGIDLSRSMLEHCRASVEGNLVGFPADTMYLPFKDSSFDAVLCSGVLMHVKDQEQALRELSRVLRPGGRLVISGNNLLSPFAWLVMARNAVRPKVLHTFKLPWFYLRTLTQLGFEVRQVIGDTILGVGIQIPVLDVFFPPAKLFPILTFPDRFLASTFAKYFAYEIWFSCVKQQDRDPM